MNILLTTTESISKLWSYMYQISELTIMNVIYEANWKDRVALPRQHVPESELWRINLLSTFMNIKITKTYSMYNMDKVKMDTFIASLCKT